MNGIIWVALSGSCSYGILSYTYMKQFRELGIFMWEMINVYRYSYYIQYSLHYKIIHIFTEYPVYIRNSENLRWIIMHCILRELKLYKRDKIYVYYYRSYKIIKWEFESRKDYFGLGREMRMEEIIFLVDLLSVECL